MKFKEYRYSHISSFIALCDIIEDFSVSSSASGG